MDSKKHGVSHGVRQVIERLFRDATFKEDALANPEAAFASYSLGDEERQAIHYLLRRKSLFAAEDTLQSFWA